MSHITHIRFQELVIMSYVEIATNLAIIYEVVRLLSQEKHHGKGELDFKRQRRVGHLYQTGYVFI